MAGRGLVFALAVARPGCVLVVCGRGPMLLAGSAFAVARPGCVLVVCGRGPMLLAGSAFALARPGCVLVACWRGPTFSGGKTLLLAGVFDGCALEGFWFILPEKVLPCVCGLPGKATRPPPGPLRVWCGDCVVVVGCPGCCGRVVVGCPGCPPVDAVFPAPLPGLVHGWLGGRFRNLFVPSKPSK